LAWKIPWVLTDVPIVWLASLRQSGLRFANRRRLLGGWLAAAAAVFALCALFIMCFGGACNRYEAVLVVLVIFLIVGIFRSSRR